MYILYDFHCDICDETFESLEEQGADFAECECGALAKRIITPITFHLNGTDLSFPTAADKWAKDHYRRAQKK